MKKILSIDGGGIRGLIPAILLAEIECQTSKSIAECFDLVAGTSTGGILALGLSLPRGDNNRKSKFSAEDLANIYRDEGEKIFPQGTWASFIRYASGLFGFSEAIYSHDGLEELLDEKFSQVTIGKALTKVLISSYEITRGEPLFFKSWAPKHQNIKMRDVARATSAAPTYFEPHQLKIDDQTHTLVDGGVFINSPAVSAYAEAKRQFPDEEDFLIVSLGTGHINPSVRYEEARDWGLAYWAKPLIKFVFDGVADAADYQLNQLFPCDPGTGKRYYRMQIELSPNSIDMDLVSEENIKRLEESAQSMLEIYREDLEQLCKLL